MPASASTPSSVTQSSCCSAVSSTTKRLMRSSCSVGRQPILARRLDAGNDLAAQAGHAHHVEFVEVRGRDGEEAQALEQRMALVLGLLQHPLVEMEPGLLAVEEAAGPERGNAGAADPMPLRSVLVSSSKILVKLTQIVPRQPGINPRNVTPRTVSLALRRRPILRPSRRLRGPSPASTSAASWRLILRPEPSAARSTASTAARSRSRASGRHAAPGSRALWDRHRAAGRRNA